MSFRKIVFTLVLCVCGALSMAQQLEPGMVVTGIGKGENGKYFAIVSGVGVVGKGDIFSSPLNATGQKYLVVSVVKNGIKVKKLVSKKTAPKKPQRKKNELRDPFVPIDAGAVSRVYGDVDLSGLQTRERWNDIFVGETLTARSG